MNKRVYGQVRQPTARSNIVLVGSVAVAIILLVLAPFTLDTYVVGLIARAFCFALLAITVDLLWGYTGVLSLGQSAFFGIGAYSIGIMFSHLTSSWWGGAVGLVAGVGVSVALAAALGWFIFYARTSLVFPFYVSVVTLALAVVFYQGVLSGGDLTGSSQGLSGFTTIPLSPRTWYFVLLGCVVLFGYIGYILVTSDAGRVLVAVRENEARCRYLGYDTAWIKLIVFSVCGALAAVSGALYAAYTSIVAPSLVGFTLGTDAVIWTALGGRGTLFGPIAGAIIINVIGPTLNAYFPYLWQLFLGVLFVAVVTAAPRGLLPVVAQPLTWLANRVAALIASGTDASERTRVIEVGGGGEHGVKELVREVDRPQTHALRVESLSKNFGSLQVLRNVAFQASHGELVSIVGPNGAGKTTLIRCIADGAERSSGRVFVEGCDIGSRGPHEIVALGVGRKFQAANVFNTLTVGDCLRLASWKGSIPSVTRKSATLDLPNASLLVLRVSGLLDYLDEPAGTLSHGLRQSLELAMVLALEPTVLLLDEPTAGLSQEERSKIADILVGLRNSARMCIILIEHDFDFVKQISSRMIVLHQGEVLLDDSVEKVSESELVRSVYLGQAHEQAA